MELSISIPLSIREARREDADGIYQLYSSLYPEDLYMRFFSFHRVTRGEIEELVKGGDHVTLVAEEGGKIVGEATLYKDGEFSLVVDPRERGAGLGTKLVQELVRKAKEMGLREVRFYTLPDNMPMIRIGRRLGFKLTFEEDEVLGVLKLDHHS
jgi:N-acetylglutamate synthase and related acetyltransferases